LLACSPFSLRCLPALLPFVLLSRFSYSFLWHAFFLRFMLLSRRCLFEMHQPLCIRVHPNALVCMHARACIVWQVLRLVDQLGEQADALFLRAQAQVRHARTPNPCHACHARTPMTTRVWFFFRSFTFNYLFFHFLFVFALTCLVKTHAGSCSRAMCARPCGRRAWH
jgi:hypothetical protein